MKIPLTRYGLRELLLYGGTSFVAALACLAFGLWPLAILPGLVCLFILSFFRDPPRRIPAEDGVFVSPADGKVVALTDVEREEFIDAPARRIDIFLALYNVHINRAPVAAEVQYLQDRDGPFLNAMQIGAGDENKARSVGFVAETGGYRFLLRQIVGQVATRIVTAVGQGARLERGQRFGMLKFGSRTQLSLPADLDVEWRVAVGDRVKAGSTILGVIRPGGTGVSGDAVAPAGEEES